MNDGTPSYLDAHLRMRASFDALRAAFRGESNPSFARRKDSLARMATLLAEYAMDFERAISDDFGHRSVYETRIAEAIVVEAAIKYALRNLRSWMKIERIRTQLHFLPGSNRLMPQPLGVVGIISPWNYPLQLTLSPVIAALAAGNRVMIKPSELAPRFSALLSAAISKHFCKTEMVVIEGGPDISEPFAALPFDHLLFTGSCRVGRIVAETAAKNLTPVTLELGGKSPAIIDQSADLGAAASSIAYGKLLNAGQTCIAPDYVLVPRHWQEMFVDHYRASVARLYGSNPDNPDYSSIVTSSHYQRLEQLLADAAAGGARVIMLSGERTDNWKAKRKFAPCLVLDTTDEMAVRQEEIFGPILPIVPYESVEDAIKFVISRDRPLALYWFGKDRAAQRLVLERTISGGVTVNDCLLHNVQETQPFGGVGPSGMGVYHGEWGFRTFSKLKPIYFRPRISIVPMLQPPYGATFETLFAVLRRVI